MVGALVCLGYTVPRVLGYTVPMKLMMEVCKCDVCSWAWLPEGSEDPLRCPSRKCRSRHWNDGKPGERAKATAREIVPQVMKSLSEIVTQAKAPPKPGQQCQECGALSGHQKWCKQRK
jgi:hypothetical protein